MSRPDKKWSSVPTPDVALVGPYPAGGERHGGGSGVASYTANLAHALAGAGATVTVTAAREPGEPAAGHDGGVRVERHYDLGPRALPDAVAAAAATGAPVVHVQHELFLYGGPTAVPGLVPALRRRSRPTVVTLHQVVDPVEVNGSFTALHRVKAPAALARLGVAGVQDAVRRLSDAVIVHEPAFAQHVPGACVIPHGVETPPRPDRAAARDTLGLDDRFTVLCFGFLAPYKGLETALDAAALAAPAVQVVVAGGEHPRLANRDPYESELRARGAGHARFTGRVPDADVAAWFAAADLALFLYPRPFSSSGALALALAYRTPFLVSPELGRCTGAPPEIVVERDANRVAERLRALATAPAELEQLRAATDRLCRERAWPEVARRHLDVYEEVNRARRPARRRVRST
jgi:glycosyltransferase involved in cell wall biosynthesis